MFEGPWFTNTNFIFTSNPMNVHHITSNNFGNNGKGPNYNEILEVLGDGILNADFLYMETRKRNTSFIA